MQNKVLTIPKTFLTICLISLSLFTLSCTPKEKNPPSPPSTETKQRVEKVVNTPEKFDASNLPLIAASPDKNIFLYGIKPKGVVLYVQDRGHFYDWDYLTPRFILPELNVGDYDNDGLDELSVILYVGSGTGYAVEDLHVIELAEKELKDYFYKPEDYLKQVNKHVKLSPYYKKGELMADIRVNNRSNGVSLKNLQSSISERFVINNEPSFGNIVYFQAKNNKLTIQMSLGVTSDLFATPEFVGDIYADVKYKAGAFTMTNLRFKPNKE